MRVNLSPAQYKIVKDPHRFKVVTAGRRFGKSVVARMWLLDQALKNPGRLYTITAPTYQQGKDIHWMQGYKVELPAQFIKSWNDSELKVMLKNGSIIQIKTAEKPDSIRGIKQGAGVIDEIASIRGWSYFWQECYRATLTDYQAPCMFIGTPQGYNHFYDLFNTHDESYASFKFTTYDNPNIPVSEIEEAKRTMTENAFAQEYLAEFRKFTGLVYPTFDRSIHVKSLPDFKPVYFIRGLDRGFRNPTASCLIAVDKDDVWYQIDEIYQSGLTNPELLPLLKQVRADRILEYSTMDSAQASDIKDLADLGEDFIPVSKESRESRENYVRWKVQKFAERLRVQNGKAGYYCDPKNVHTIEEFEKYRWRESRTGFEDLNVLEEPEKANDHMMDALADLNGMYEYDYKEKPKDRDKLEGTYAKPSIIEDDEGNVYSDASNDW